MNIVMDYGVLPETSVTAWIVPEGDEEVPLAALVGGDVVELSQEALDRLDQSPFKTLRNRVPTVDKLGKRISVLRGQMDEIWHSPLPDDEKMRQIDSIKTEISLLQAGQYTLAKAGFIGTV